MSLDLQQKRQQAHALIDLLPPAKLGAVSLSKALRVRKRLATRLKQIRLSRAGL